MTMIKPGESGDSSSTKGKRLTEVEQRTLLEQLRPRYEAGSSIRELAEETGRSYGSINRLLVQGGVTMRKRGGNVRKS